MGQNKKIFIIAGEASGDIIGAKMMDSLKKENHNIEFHGIGGTQMAFKGLKSIVPIDQLSLMGFIEVIPHIFKINSYINHTVKRAIEYQPDLVITIDFPGFNRRIVEKLRKENLNAKFIHIVAPSVWAYKPERAQKAAKLYDLLLTLLPFEPPLFTKHGLDAQFIGHPIFEQNFRRNEADFKRKYNIPKDAEVVTITPGSRKGEIQKHTEIFVKTLALLKTKYNIFALFILNDPSHKDFIKPIIKDSLPHKFIDTKEKIEAFVSSDVALAKSGTNVLEILACNTPAIVAYKVNFLTYLYIKFKALIKHVSLVNILANKEIVPEFLQNDCKPVKMANAIAKYIENDRLAEIEVMEAQTIMRQIGFEEKVGASTKAAQIIAKKYFR